MLVLLALSLLSLVIISMMWYAYSPYRTMDSNNIRTMVVFGSGEFLSTVFIFKPAGGHTAEMVPFLKKLPSKYASHVYVLAESDNMSEDKLKSLGLIDEVLCNGPGTCIPICFAAYLLRLDTCEPIQLSLVVGGADSTRQAVTLFKSIFFHAGLIRWSLGETDPVELNTYCAPRFHFHLIVDPRARVSLQSVFDSWQLTSVEYSFYEYQNHRIYVAWIPTTHYSADYGLAKLLLAEILPQSIEKVINLDVDLLVNSDIHELWSHFNRFKPTQMIGLVRNQSPWYLQQSMTDIWPALGTGYNTGVMLVHLQKLRLAHWDHEWRTITKKMLQTHTNAPLADQDVINAVLVNMPEALYELPCAWNVQMNARVKASWQCPVSWQVHSETSLRIAHYNNPEKPESMNSGTIWREYEGNSEEELQGTQMRLQFMERYRFFREYDGNLIKDQLRNLHERGKNERESIGQNKIYLDRCTNFRNSHQMSHRIHAFFVHNGFSTHWTNNTNVNNSNTHDLVTLTTQLSFDRIHRLDSLTNHWPGPMSLAIYATDHEASILGEFIAASPNLVRRTNIGYHIVYSSGTYYPINRLRNVAIRYAQTDYTFIVDVDFLPSENCHQYLCEIIYNQMISTGKMDKISFIVPAFESARDRADLPNTKAKLIDEWRKGTITPFRHQLWTAGHLATNYSIWKNTSKVYEVEWTADYEPYVVVKRNAIQFDEHFIGFGWNKASFIMNLDALNYRFFVLPKVFLIHLPHPPGIEVLRYRSNHLYRKCSAGMRNARITKSPENNQIKISQKLATRHAYGLYCMEKFKIEFVKELAGRYGVKALKYLEFRRESAE